MDRYIVFKKLGEGSYGIVWKALDLETGEDVAIKILKNKYASWEKCKQEVELTFLANLEHPNVIQLKNYAYERGNQRLCLIFDYMESNLFQLIELSKRQPLSEDTIRDVASQLLQGLSYIHWKGYFHRDLKPENLLLQSGVLKIADFGMARDVNSSLPFEREVSTLWYRAPEVLLGKSYDEKIDMWAVGVILAELYNSEPLFPEANNMDQMCKIWEVAGVPDDLPFFLEADRKQNLYWTLRHVIPRASEQAIDLIQQLLSWNPANRPTASQAFFHPFFNTRPIPKQRQRHQNIVAPIGSKIAPKIAPIGSKIAPKIAV